MMGKIKSRSDLVAGYYEVSICEQEQKFVTKSFLLPAYQQMPESRFDKSPLKFPWLVGTMSREQYNICMCANELRDSLNELLKH